VKIAAGLVGLAIAACTPAPAPRSLGLVALVVIDQLPSWAFTEREPLLEHGLGRLVHEGTVFTDARYPYAATFTAPGHAALSTGAPPSVTGIVGNDWWDRDEERRVEAVADVGYPPLVVGGWPGELETTTSRASGSRLRVDGIGDVLRRSGGRAVGVSLKSRAAILATGRHAELAVWYDGAQRAFTTSTWYRLRVPEWLERLRCEHPIGPRLVDEWQPIDAALLARATGQPDDAPGEGGGTPFGTTFPHRPLQLPDPAEAIKTMPLGDTVVREAALAAVDGERLGQGPAPDLLVVSFSVHDYIGHTFGQESWEALDDLLRLDQEIDALVAGLEARVGAGRVAVVVTSDHGAVRMPEKSRAAGHPALRVDVDDLRRAVEAAVAPIAGPGPWLDAWREPSLTFAHRFAALPDRVRDRALDAAAAAAAGVEGIAIAARTDRVAGACDPRPDPEAMVCRAIDRERSGDIYVAARAGSMILDIDRDPIAHGSANPDDTTVPVIVWGPGIPARRVSAPVSTLQVAPTLAGLLGVPPPPAATAPPLL
jgi:arylsulfatase A-like enzyme